MITDKYGQMVFNPDEIFEIAMHDLDPYNDDYRPGPFLVASQSMDINQTNRVAGYNAVVEYQSEDIPIEEFDKRNQTEWLMPDYYKELDIAAYILDLCESDAELQRCGEELLLYVERDLLDVLKYMKYLVDVMELNNVIWGVGRGSSVSSFVLYKLGVHRIDSLYYQLDPREFLR